MNVGKLVGGLCVAATAALIGDTCACARIRRRTEKYFSDYFNADSAKKILYAGVHEAFSDPKLEENIKEVVKEEVERRLKEESPGD